MGIKVFSVGLTLYLQMLILWVGRFEVGGLSYEGLSLKEWKLFFSCLLGERNNDRDEHGDKVVYAQNIKEENWKVACESDNRSVRKVVMRGGCMKGGTFRLNNSLFFVCICKCPPFNTFEITHTVYLYYCFTFLTNL